MKHFDIIFGYENPCIFHFMTHYFFPLMNVLNYSLSNYIKILGKNWVGRLSRTDNLAEYIEDAFLIGCLMKHLLVSLFYSFLMLQWYIKFWKLNNVKQDSAPQKRKKYNNKSGNKIVFDKIYVCSNIYLILSSIVNPVENSANLYCLRLSKVFQK